MQRISRTGILVTLIASVLLVAQFAISFVQQLGNNLAGNSGLAFIVFHLTPYALLLVGLYILLAKKKTPGIENRWIRIALAIVASWGLAGAGFLVLVILALVMKGGDGVEAVFSHLIVISIVLTLLCFPLVYRKLE